MWKPDIGRAKAITAGNMRSYAVLKDGTVWSWKNIVQKKKYAAAQLPGFAKMTTIAAGSRNTDFAVGLDEKGNQRGIRGPGATIPPALRTGNLYQKADYAAAANSNVFVISNGQLWVYGTNNDYGQLGNGTRANSREL
ncbi:RCC1 domain-containing protein [Paenibacillus thiaminolyticus]|uniref:RCC1 domain-containing protein n=1 Tax=Paenibacillus thiaminolyticus TaxID=49283 RepID=UPI002543054E|nr:RCC1 domain-containing protein [Paenibacillus thiaminolyticus]WII37026.1 RCC1 domain-containing protein [Paenibacillus thiaminolyticus]